MNFGADSSQFFSKSDSSGASRNSTDGASVAAGASIYLHFPFCSKLCGYCDFHKELFNRRKESLYFEALMIETELATGEGSPKDSTTGSKTTLDSLYIGGGTPSLMNDSLLAEWLEAVQRQYALTSETEFTIEINPESAHRENLERFRELGANRLSVGVQSFDTEALANLDRRHNVEDTIRVFYLARALGYENFSADLIFGFPNHTLGVLESDLQQIVELEPSHISFYQLTVKENTPLAERVKSGAVELPDSDTMALFYRAGSEFLGDHGYNRYEISSFARAGMESRHNSRYWSGEAYIGFGPGAHGFNGKDRYAVVSDTAEYCRLLIEENKRPLTWDRLTKSDRMLEDIMLGLRTSAGVDKVRFKARYGQEINSQLNSREFSSLVESGHILPAGRALRLSDAAMAMADEIISRLVS